MTDLRAVAESEGEEDGVNKKWLRKRRGDLVKGGATAEEVDALTMLEFFLAITGRLQLGVPPVPAKSMSAKDATSVATVKHKPTAKTRRAIELIQKGQRSDRQIEQLSGVADVFKVRSRLKNGEYDLTS